VKCIKLKRLLQNLGIYVNIMSKLVSKEYSVRVGWIQLNVAEFLDFVTRLVFRTERNVL
jgi:hypothetical protein